MTVDDSSGATRRPCIAEGRMLLDRRGFAFEPRTAPSSGVDRPAGRRRWRGLTGYWASLVRRHLERAVPLRPVHQHFATSADAGIAC